MGGNSLSYSDPLGLDALGSYIGGNIGAVLAGALGIETGPFAVPISVLGRLAGAAIGSTIEDYISKIKPPDNAYDPKGPKAPGKPTKEDGFEDPKGGEDWVPNPNPGKGGSKWGWRDKKGNVWCPTGPKNESGRGIAHGDPHWDVQLPNGDYKNIRPKKP